MPHFCESCGADEVVCQGCRVPFCSKEDDVKWVDGSGNLCRACRRKKGLEVDDGTPIVEQSNRDGNDATGKKEGVGSTG